MLSARVLVVAELLGDFVLRLDLHLHQRLQRLLVHRGELLCRQTQIVAAIRRGVSLSISSGGMTGLDQGAVHLAQEDRQRLARDEHEDQEDHQDGRERDEEDELLRQPLQRTRLVPAVDAHPAERRVCLMVCVLCIARRTESGGAELAIRESASA